jgi:hypothetical protein
MIGAPVFRYVLTPGWAGDSLARAAQAVPSLDLNFAVTKNIGPLVTFTRASNATYIDSAGTLQTAVTNLLLRSEEFDNASWAKTQSSVSSNTATSPAGGTTADSLVEDSAASVQHYIIQNPSITANTNYTASVYVKANTRSSVRFGFLNSGLVNGAYAHFNASTGVISSQTTAGTATNISYSMDSVGSGWYRCRVTCTVDTSSATGAFFVGLVDGSNNVIYTGNGTSGIFLWGAQLEQASSVGEYISTTSTINSAPRFDHNPTTGESLGLLVEEQRTNLLLQSEEFDNAGWPRSGTTLPTITANASVAPDGATTADLWTRSIIGSNFISQAPVKTASAIQYTFSVFVKQSVGNFCALRCQGTFPNKVDVVFNISSGTISTAATVAGGTFTGPSASITAYPNGWYRLTVTATSDTALVYQCIASFSSNGVLVDGTDSVSTSAGLLWGAQLEAGAFPTSYIPTTTATATRAADVASITGSNFSGWYNATAGTIYHQGTPATAANFYSIDDATTNNRITSYMTGATTPFMFVSTGGVSQVNLTSSAITSGAAFAQASAYQASSFAVSTNGGTPGTSVSGTVPTVSRMIIGANVNGAAAVNGTIRRLVFWPTRLANSTLQAITQ